MKIEACEVGTFIISLVGDESMAWRSLVRSAPSRRCMPCALGRMGIAHGDLFVRRARLSRYRLVADGQNRPYEAYCNRSHLSCWRWYVDVGGVCDLCLVLRLGQNA
jgi:hypothetical protein